MTIHIPVPVEDAQKVRLDQIAEARHETAADVMAEAVAEYLEYDAWFVAEVEKGMASIERGDLRDFDDVARDLRARMDARVRQVSR